MESPAITAPPQPLTGMWSQAQATAGRARFYMALVLLACLFYTFPVVKTPLGYTTYLRLDDFASAVFVLASIGAITNRRRSVESPVFQILLITALVAPLSILIGVMGYRDSFALKYAPWQLMQYYRVFLIFAAASVLEIDMRRFRQVLFVMWCGSIFVGIFAFMQYFGLISYRGLAEEFAESGPWQAVLERAEFGVVVGPLSHNHAVLGNYMTVAIILTFALIRTGALAMKPFYQLSIPFFAIVSVLSNSRAGLAGVVFGLFLYLLLSKARPAAVVGFLLGMIAVGVVINMTPQFQERFIMSKSGKTVAEFSSGRIEGWFDIFGLVARHPELLLLGCGMGHFRVLYDRGWTNLAYAHNNYLHWLVESSIIAVVLALITFWRLASVFRTLIRYGERVEREVGVAMLALLLALLAIATTQENFVPSSGMASTPAYFAFLFGITVALCRNMIFRHQTAAYYYWAAAQHAQQQATPATADPGVAR